MRERGPREREIVELSLLPLYSGAPRLRENSFGKVPSAPTWSHVHSDTHARVCRTCVYMCVHICITYVARYAFHIQRHENETGYERIRVARIYTRTRVHLYVYINIYTCTCARCMYNARFRPKWRIACRLYSIPVKMAHGRIVSRGFAEEAGVARGSILDTYTTQVRNTYTNTHEKRPKYAVHQTYM